MANRLNEPKRIFQFNVAKINQNPKGQNKQKI
jgi:hypothetical protein